MDKLKSIKEGWGKVIFPDQVTEAMATARAAVCAPCEHNKLSVCSVCLCPLAAKTRSKYESCPKKKW